MFVYIPWYWGYTANYPSVGEVAPPLQTKTLTILLQNQLLPVLSLLRRERVRERE